MGDNEIISTSGSGHSKKITRYKEIPSSTRSQIESKIEDINLLLTSCMPFAAMHGLKNLSSDLRAEVDIRKNISHEEYTNYMKRLENLILITAENCKCSKKKS